ncbi:uncharacterized protein CLUP02_16056 [Colletotrichum lupini]|uniref:Uncharacterized protein n=1 Tax=Colletotrichum lupini TaxID=145971 RepID=A0A9Q8T773_9PEZI|nr:uncharacterized protein CLUP02_16056 [Colletotrichum lupini]UQC90526.1 hypothetical protein CLUP02_16056 [Colletotrichum lupini]
MVNCEDDAKNLTDPDIMGFGVLLSFVFPVLASHVIMTMAYVTRRANPEGFTHMDTMIHNRLGAYESKISRLRSVKYEHLLLTISDQLSVTSFALLVALYSQILTISSFSFSVGVSLAFISFGVHTNCLIGLALSILDNLFTPVSLKQVAACTIRGSGTTDTSILAAVALIWIFGKSYYDAIARLYLLLPLQDNILRLLCFTEESRKYFRILYQQKTRKEIQKTKAMLRKLSDKHTNHFQTIRLATPVLVEDMLDSIFWSLFQDMSFTVYLLYDLVSMIALAGKEEIESLLEPKFGQILPLLLLIVFIINVFDAKEIEYSRVASTIEIPESPENFMESDVALHAATPSTTEEAIPMSETSNTTTSADFQRQPHTHVTLPLPTRITGRSNTAIRQVDGVDQEEMNMTGRYNLTGRQDSGLSTPNRSRTPLMESGATSISFDLQDEYEEDLKAALKMRNLRLQLAEKTAEKVPWCAWVVLWSAVAMLAGFLALLVIYGVWVALSIFAFAVIMLFGSILRGLWEIRRIRASAKAMETPKEGRPNRQER